MDAIGHALGLAGAMTWEILWAMILGFALSAVVQAVVRRATIIRLLGDTYFLALTMTPGGNFGKGRYLMRTAAPKLMAEF